MALEIFAVDFFLVAIFLLLYSLFTLFKMLFKRFVKNRKGGEK